jgi:ElaB/YqjD/DUF883 family membrane-anchored ribosome-binding protein
MDNPLILYEYPGNLLLFLINHFFTPKEWLMKYASVINEFQKKIDQAKENAAQNEQKRLAAAEVYVTDRPYRPIRFDEAKAQLPSYFEWRENQLNKVLEGLMSSYSSTANGEVEEFESLIGSTIGQANGKIQEMLKPQDNILLVDAINFLATHEEIFFTGIGRLNCVARGIGDTWEANLKYQAKTSELEAVLKRVTSELQDNFRKVDAESHEIKNVLDKLAEMIRAKWNSIYSTISEAVNTGKIPPSKWKDDVGELAGFIAYEVEKLVDHIDALKPQCFDHAETMAYYEEHYQATKVFMSTCSLDRSRGDLNSHRTDSNLFFANFDVTQYKDDIALYWADMLEKWNREIETFQKVYDNFVEKYDQIFFHRDSQKIKSIMFFLEDRAQDWSQIYEKLYNYHLLDDLHQVQGWYDILMTIDSSLRSPNTPELTAFVSDLRFELAKLASESRKIDQNLVNELKLYIFDYYNNFGWRD